MRVWCPAVKWNAEEGRCVLAPSTRKQVRQFLGFANFYRRFRFLPPNFASITAPLTKLTSVKVPFVWFNATQTSFDKIKLLLTSTPVLVHPDFNLPFHIHCDSSGKGRAPRPKNQ